MNIHTKIKKNDFDEFVVKLYVDGEHQKKSDYFTDDFEDAHITAKDMRERVQPKNTLLGKMTPQAALKILLEAIEPELPPIRSGKCNEAIRIAEEVLDASIH